MDAPLIMPLRGTISAGEVEAACPGDGRIFACDFYVQGAEQGTLEGGGLRIGRVLNVDHHAPITEMEREVTSTMLAAEFVRQHGEDVIRDGCVVINHTDCDSILSSAIMAGALPPDDRYVDASVDADHTGAANLIADVLQALDESRRGTRTQAQYVESLDCVMRLDAGRELPVAAMHALQRHGERREAARELVHSGRVRVEGGVAFARSDVEIDGAFFPALLPNAQVIVLASPNRDDPTRFTIKVRRGRAAPDGVTLHKLGITALDTNYGGRWNAGSNKRDGGTHIVPEAFARHLREQLARHAGTPLAAR